jgi:hypothetical protein
MHITESQLNDFVEQAVASAQAGQQRPRHRGALGRARHSATSSRARCSPSSPRLFILIDGKGIWHWIVGVFPRRARAAVDGAGQAGWATLQNFVKVQILVATIDAIGIGLGAFLLGVPLAVPIAILVFLGRSSPIVGAS